MLPSPLVHNYAETDCDACKLKNYAEFRSQLFTLQTSSNTHKTYYTIKTTAFFFANRRNFPRGPITQFTRFHRQPQCDPMIRNRETETELKTNENTFFSFSPGSRTLNGQPWTSLGSRCCRDRRHRLRISI